MFLEHHPLDFLHHLFLQLLKLLTQRVKLPCLPAVAYLDRQVALWPHHKAEHTMSTAGCVSTQHWEVLCHQTCLPHVVYTRTGTQICTVISSNATVSTHFSSSLDRFRMTLRESGWHLCGPRDFAHLLWPQTIHNDLWPLTFSVVMLLLEFSRTCLELCRRTCHSFWEDTWKGQCFLLNP